MQVEHKTEKGTVLFVKLGYEPYYPVMVINESYCSYLIYKKKADKGYKTIRHKLPLADWKLIGLTSEVTEEQLYQIFSKKIGVLYEMFGYDYLTSDIKISFKSLI